MVAGVDRFTDGLRTALNAMGNCANAAMLERISIRNDDTGFANQSVSSNDSRASD